MKPHAARRIALVALASSVVACGQHVLVGGQGGNGTKADAGAKDGATTEADAGEILCGSSACGPVDVGGGLGVREPCCYDFSKCGARLPNICIELDSPGVQDPACPSVTGYPGCCRPSGTCGLLLAGRFGCLDPFGIFPTAVLPKCVPQDQ